MYDIIHDMENEVDFAVCEVAYDVVYDVEYEVNHAVHDVK